MNQTVTIFKDINSKEPFYITMAAALDRIKTGKSKEIVEKIRLETDRDKRNEIKATLPSILFSGKFKDRKNDSLVEHSEFVILDFDHISNVDELKTEIFGEPFILATWISPSGDGVKALAKIKNPKKHREHYKSLLKYFEKCEVNPDKQNVNEARVCYESYDEKILIKDSVKDYEDILEERTTIIQHTVTSPLTDDGKIYAKLKKWIENKGELFVEGNRHNMLMRFAAACNRTGIHRDTAFGLLAADFLHGSTFSVKELQGIIESIYKNYSNQFGIARFQDTQIINATTTEIIDEKIFDCSLPIKDLIYFRDVYDNLEERLAKGVSKGETTHFPILDEHFRWMRREINVVHGFGNHGKSTMALQLMLFKSVFCGYKWCVFNPENSPADFFYQDVAEMYAGKLFDKKSHNPATDAERNRAKDFVNEHFFYIYPKDDMPTPDYVLKRFVEVIIKHKVDGVLIDPFNQLVHERGMGRDDHYLEFFHNKVKRFAQNQDIFFAICAHPNKPEKSGKKQIYDEPSVYDLSGGAMWNNKTDNILCYHRPNFFIDPKDPWCIFSSQKIKKQKLNGVPGTVNYIYDRQKSRFFEITSQPSGGERGYNPLEDGNNVPSPSPVSPMGTDSGGHFSESESDADFIRDFSQPMRENDDIGF